MSAFRVVTHKDESEEPMLRYFNADRPPKCTPEMERYFVNMAFFLVDTLPRSGERTLALAKLFECKNFASRAKGLEG